MAGMSASGYVPHGYNFGGQSSYTGQRPRDRAPANSYWNPDTRQYQNTQGQSWSDAYGWVGAPTQQNQQSAMTGLRSAGGGGSSSSASGSSLPYFMQPDYMTPQQQQQFDTQGQVGLQQDLDQARITAERSYQQGAVPMQIENVERLLGILTGAQGAGGNRPSRETHGGAAENEARAAAYARAKDQIGQQTTGAMETLRNAYGGSGMIGSEREALQRAAGTGFNNLGEVTREQLIRDLNRAAEVSDLTYQGGITQRGQDMAMIAPILGNLARIGTLY
jgi:hypothetical protein